MNINDIKYLDINVVHDEEGNGIYSRTIYYNPVNSVYLKVWHSDYFYKEFFISAYKSGFFDEIAQITELIVDDDGDVRGYVTKEGKPVHYYNLDKHKYNVLRLLLIVASKKNDMVYLDFRVANVVDVDDQYYLVDLESTVPADKLSGIERLRSTWECNDYAYRKEVDYEGIDSGPIKVVRFGTERDKPIEYGEANGRVYLEKEYLPSLSGSILFVGVNYYNNFYHRLTKNPELFETLDVIEDRIEHGSPYTHYIGNIIEFAGADYKYDNVCFFGILDDDWDKTEKGVDKTMEVLDKLVRPGGTLLIGPVANWRVKYWDGVFDKLTNYEVLMKRKIDINYVWYGRKTRYARL